VIPEPSSQSQAVSAASEPLGSSPRQVRVVTALLRRAVQLFVRSQLTAVQSLEVTLQGGDRQLLSGSIPQVGLTAQAAIYQGLHLSEVAIQGHHIRVNLGQVMRGKPLRLLEDILVQAELKLRESDLQSSLGSPLLDDLLCQVVTGSLVYLPQFSTPVPLTRADLQQFQIQLAAGEIQLQAIFADAPSAMEMHPWQGQCWRAIAQIVLLNPSTLEFQNLRLCLSPKDPDPAAASALSWISIPAIQLPLGSDVELHHLSVQPGLLQGRGTVRVRP
jgi:hypothetical protein